MSKMICLDCGHLFDEGEASTWKEGRGEYWGMECYESVSGCPQCHGSYAKAVKCDICDEYIDGDYMMTEDGQRFCMHCLTPMSLGDES
jgi:hypothetical protein